MIFNNQPNMVVQDELSSLFSKNLTLTPKPPPTPPQGGKIVYVSQHYNHSAHVMAQQQPPLGQQDEPMQRPSSEPPQTGLEDLELLLRSQGVDTTTLSLPQVELFRNAEDAQKARLIQLWTICPPGNATDNPTLTWSNTTVEQEEMLAQRRFEHQQQQGPVAEVVMSLDGTDTGTTYGSSPISMQSGDGRWVGHAQHYMEPYMQSGYEQLAKREYDATADRYKVSTDPVYQSTRGVLDYERQQWMENQYGSIVGGWGNDEEML